MPNRFWTPNSWMWLMRLNIFNRFSSLSSVARRLLAALVVLSSSAVVPLDASAVDLLESLRGEPAPGALMIGKTLPQVEVMLEGESLAVTEDGYFAFGFGRDETGMRTLSLVLGEQSETVPLNLAERQWQVQHVEGVPQETVTPPPDRLARIREEAGLVRAARETRSTLQGFLEDFIWPATGPISGVYGSQRFYNGEPRRPHYGVDIAGPTGTPVYAPASGKVSLVHEDMFYSGGTLILDHGYGISSTFIHLDAVLVSAGDTVEQGQLIARIGSSGRSTGPHLDWRINWYHTRLDPQWFMGGTDLTSVESPADQARVAGDGG